MEIGAIKRDLKTIFYSYKSTFNAHKEYYWKLCDVSYGKHNTTLIKLQIRGSRKIFEFAINDIISDSDLIADLHPIDAFIIGIIANDVRNGILNDGIAWNNNWFIPHVCPVKITPVLKIESKHTSDIIDENRVVLKNIYTNKRITLPINTITDHLEIIYAISPIEAISLGYDLSEIRIRLYQS